MLPRLANFARDTSGAVAPLFATALIGLVGAGALAWDISRGYAMRAELEAAVDAAALAGATQLDGGSDALTRATTAAQGALVQNAKAMGNTYEANVVTASSGDTIQYLTNLTGSRDPTALNSAVTADPAEAKFIEITLAPRPMGLVLGALVGAGAFNGRAHAVAGYGSALCKVPPMFVCNPDEKNGVETFNSYAGHSILMNGVGGKTAFGPGNFGYLQVGGTLKALENALGRSPPLTECFGETVDTFPGDPTILDWLNTRFDIYSDNTLKKLKGDPHFAPAEVTVTGRPDNSKDKCNPKTSGTTYNGFYDASITAMAMPRDTCAYSNYVGTKCTSGANAIGNGLWDKLSYFKVTHYPAMTTVDSVKSPTGENWSDFYDYPDASPKPTYPTRYQVYLWEKAHKDMASAWKSYAPANTKDKETGDWATRQCSTSDPAPGQPDRRTFSAIVLNCSGLQGKSVDQAVIGAVDIFLPEPADPTGNSGNGTIYGEIISATSDTSAIGQETRVYSVRLYE